jgi:hypothetical protein
MRFHQSLELYRNPGTKVEAGLVEKEKNVKDYLWREGLSKIK